MLIQNTHNMQGKKKQFRKIGIELAQSFKTQAHTYAHKVSKRHTPTKRKCLQK